MITGRPSVLVDMRKYDGSLNKQWNAVLLGEDEHGVWLGTRRGEPLRSRKGGWASEHTFVIVLPRTEWWAAWFCTDPGPEMYCDVCAVPEWNADGTVVRTIDLDLDVVRGRDGEVRIKDEDEFAENRVRYGYPDSVVDQARRTCDWLAEAGRRDASGTEPFRGAYRPWLDLIA